MPWLRPCEGSSGDNSDGYPVWPCGGWCLGDPDAHNNCQVTSIYLVSHSWCQFTNGGQHIMSMIDPKMLISYLLWSINVKVFTILWSLWWNLTISAYTIRKSITLRFFWYPTFVYNTCVFGWRYTATLLCYVFLWSMAVDVKLFTTYHLDRLFCSRPKLVIHCYLLKPL